MLKEYNCLRINIYFVNIRREKDFSRSRRYLFPTIVGKIAFNIYFVNVRRPYNRRENTIVGKINRLVGKIPTVGESGKFIRAEAKGQAEPQKTEGLKSYNKKL